MTILNLAGRVQHSAFSTQPQAFGPKMADTRARDAKISDG
jgi:hypothetical protein